MLSEPENVQVIGPGVADRHGHDRLTSRYRGVFEHMASQGFQMAEIQRQGRTWRGFVRDDVEAERDRLEGFDLAAWTKHPMLRRLAVEEADWVPLKPRDTLPTAVILERLAERYGIEHTAESLADALRPFGFRSRTIRYGDQVLRGYRRANRIPALLQWPVQELVQAEWSPAPSGPPVALAVAEPVAPARRRGLLRR